MNNNFIFKLHIVLLLLSSLGGGVSFVLMRELWGLEHLDYMVAVNIFLLYILTMPIFYYFIKNNIVTRVTIKLKYNKYHIYAFIILYSISAVISLYFSISNIGYLGESDVYIPGSTLFISILMFVPFLLNSYSTKLSRVFILLSVIIFAFSMVRFNIVIMGIMFLFLHGKTIRFSRLAAYLIGVILVFLLVSFYRDGDVPYNKETQLAEVASSMVGSEWRDGIIFNQSVSQDDLNNSKKYLLENLFLSGLPFWSWIPGIDANKIRRNQISYFVLIESKLDERGYTGIRVGMLWESHMLFGYYGVILLSLVNAFIVSLANNIKHDNWIGFSRFIISIAAIYSIVGQSGMYLGVFVQYAIYAALILFIVDVIIKVITIK